MRQKQKKAGFFHGNGSIDLVLFNFLKATDYFAGKMRRLPVAFKLFQRLPHFFIFFPTMKLFPDFLPSWTIMGLYYSVNHDLDFLHAVKKEFYVVVWFGIVLSPQKARESAGRGVTDREIIGSQRKPNQA